MTSDVFKILGARKLDGKVIVLNRFTVKEGDHLFRRQMYLCPTISLCLCPSALQQSFYCFTTLIKGALQHPISTSESALKSAQCCSIQYSVDS